MIRGYHWSNKAWCASVLNLKKQEINFGLYDKQGGTDGEMKITWVELGLKKVPKLEIFDDAWKVLHSFSDVLAKLSDYDNKNIPPETFVEILQSCGFEDLTKYTNTEQE